MKTETRLRHADRLLPVLDWLMAHPDDEPDLYHLAELACLSPFHFHRVYRAMTGETVTATAQRMRLHRAAGELETGGRSLAQVARRAGYQSAAAFGRAFTQAYGVPPGRYRAQRARLPHPQEPIMHTVTLEDFSGLTLATLPHRGSYESIGVAFDRLYMLAGARGLADTETVGYGVYYDDPAQTAVDALRSSAGIPVAAGADLDAVFERVVLPAGRCAVLEHVGPYSELEAAYAWLFGPWLAQSGHEPADVPVFEAYLNDPKTTPPAELLTRIYLPLA